MYHRLNYKIQNYKTPRRQHRNIGENLPDFCSNRDFLHITPKIKSTNRIIDIVNFIEIKSSCLVQNNVKRIRTQALDWDKNLKKTYLVKD